MGLDSSFPAPVNTEFVMVISGRECEPCSALLRDVEAEPAPVQAPYDQVCDEVLGLRLVFDRCMVWLPAEYAQERTQQPGKS